MFFELAPLEHRDLQVLALEPVEKSDGVTVCRQLAPLLPPAPRSKARYMNLDELVTWGVRALRYLDDPRPLPDWTLDHALLHEKLGWLSDYRNALAEWKSVMDVISAACHYVRYQHLGITVQAKRHHVLVAAGTRTG